MRRALARFVSPALLLPFIFASHLPFSYALRGEAPPEAGLEEKITKALRSVAATFGFPSETLPAASASGGLEETQRLIGILLSRSEDAPWMSKERLRARDELTRRFIETRSIQEQAEILTGLLGEADLWRRQRQEDGPRLPPGRLIRAGPIGNFSAWITQDPRVMEKVKGVLREFIRLYPQKHSQVQQTLNWMSQMASDGPWKGTPAERSFQQLAGVLSGLEERVLGHPSGVTAVAFSPDGKILASGEIRGVIRFWDPAAGKETGSFRAHKGRIRSLAFHPDAAVLATSSEGRNIRFWKVPTGEPIPKRTLPGVHANWVPTLAFSPDGKTLASGSHDKTIKLWNPTTGELRRTLEAEMAKVWTVAFSPDGKTLISGHGDGQIRFWDVATGEIRRTLEEAHRGAVRAAAFSPDGKILASAGTDWAIRLWDPVGNSVARLQAEPEREKGADYDPEVYSVAFSPDGRIVAAAYQDEKVRLWDVPARRLLATLEGHLEPVLSVAFSPDGKTVASGSDDRTLRLWDMAGVRRRLEGERQLVEAWFRYDRAQGAMIEAALNHREDPRFAQKRRAEKKAADDALLDLQRWLIPLERHPDLEEARERFKRAESGFLQAALEPGQPHLKRAERQVQEAKKALVRLEGRGPDAEAGLEERGAGILQFDRVRVPGIGPLKITTQGLDSSGPNAQPTSSWLKMRVVETRLRREGLLRIGGALDITTRRVTTDGGAREKALHGVVVELLKESKNPDAALLQPAIQAILNAQEVDEAEAVKHLMVSGRVVLKDSPSIPRNAIPVPPIVSLREGGAVDPDLLLEITQLLRPLFPMDLPGLSLKDAYEVLEIQKYSKNGRRLNQLSEGWMVRWLTGGAVPKERRDKPLPPLIRRAVNEELSLVPAILVALKTKRPEEELKQVANRFWGAEGFAFRTAQVLRFPASESEASSFFDSGLEEAPRVARLLHEESLPFVESLSSKGLVIADHSGILTPKSRPLGEKQRSLTLEDVKRFLAGSPDHAVEFVPRRDGSQPDALFLIDTSNLSEGYLTHLRNSLKAPLPAAGLEEDQRFIQSLTGIAAGRAPTQEEIQELAEWILSDPVQTAILGVPPGKVAEEVVRERIEVMQKAWPTFSIWWREYLKTDQVPTDTLWRVYIPFSQWIVEQKRAVQPDGLYVVGVYGSQGRGKTVTSRALVPILNVLLAPEEGQAVARAIDDYYLSKAEREKLKSLGYDPGPGVSNRGPAGTHDTDWIRRNIEEFERSTPESRIEMGNFQKGIDDQPAEPFIFHGKAGVFLFDGWFNGAHTDFDLNNVPAGFKRTVAEKLQRDYKPIFDRFDALWAFDTPDIEVVEANRQQQEERKDQRAMSQEEIHRFVRYFYRDSWDWEITSPIPRVEDVTFLATIDANRRFVSIQRGSRPLRPSAGLEERAIDREKLSDVEFLTALLGLEERQAVPRWKLNHEEGVQKLHHLSIGLLYAWQIHRPDAQIYREYEMIEGPWSPAQAEEFLTAHPIAILEQHYAQSDLFIVRTVAENEPSGHLENVQKFLQTELARLANSSDQLTTGLEEGLDYGGGQEVGISGRDAGASQVGLAEGRSQLGQTPWPRQYLTEPTVGFAGRSSVSSLSAKQQRSGNANREDKPTQAKSPWIKRFSAEEGSDNQRRPGDGGHIRQDRRTSIALFVGEPQHPTIYKSTIAPETHQRLRAAGLEESGEQEEPWDIQEARDQARVFQQLALGRRTIAQIEEELNAAQAQMEAARREEVAQRLSESSDQERLQEATAAYEEAKERIEALQAELRLLRLSDSASLAETDRPPPRPPLRWSPSLRKPRDSGQASLGSGLEEFSSSKQYSAEAKRLQKARLYDKAEALLRQGVQRFPKDPFLWTMRTTALLRLHRVREAIQHGLETARRFPNDPVAQTTLTNALAKKTQGESHSSLGGPTQLASGLEEERVQEGAVLTVEGQEPELSGRGASDDVAGGTAQSQTLSLPTGQLPISGSLWSQGPSQSPLGNSHILSQNSAANPLPAQAFTNQGTGFMNKPDNNAAGSNSLNTSITDLDTNSFRFSEKNGLPTLLSLPQGTSTFNPTGLEEEPREIQEARGAVHDAQILLDAAQWEGDEGLARSIQQELWQAQGRLNRLRAEPPASMANSTGAAEGPIDWDAALLEEEMDLAQARSSLGPRIPLQLVFRPENAGLALLLPAEGVEVRIVVASLEQRQMLFKLRSDLAGAFIPGYEYDSIEKAVDAAKRQLGPEAVEVREILARDRTALRLQVEGWLAGYPWEAPALEDRLLDAVLAGTQA